MTPPGCRTAMVLLPFETSIPTALYILMYLLKMNLHGIQHSSLLIQSPGVSNGHVQGQSNLHKSNGCKMIGWLTGFLADTLKWS